MSESSRSKVNFFFDNASISLKNRKKLKLFIKFIFNQEKRKLAALNYIFCRDKRVRQINKEYLGHDYFTDIITFEFSEPGQPVISDVYISVDRVKENTVSHETSLNEEVHRVMFHGALHLCGYADKTAAEKKRMRKREDFYLSKFTS